MRTIKFSKNVADDKEKIKQLYILLGEARRRGIDVSNIIRERTKKEELKWPLDDEGYFPPNEGRPYRPNENQKRFLLSKARFCALISGRGGGKTATGAQKALFKIMSGESGAVVNPDFENFRYSTWPELRKWIPWGMVVPRDRRMGLHSWEPHQPFVIHFMNGQSMICKGLKDPQSSRGANINWFWYDEAGRDVTGMSWQLGIASVRIGKMPQAWITTTPAGVDHWIYKFFVQQDIPKEARELFDEIEKDRELIEVVFTSTMDNAANLDPSFFAALLSAYPAGYLRDQEIYGKFVAQEGSIGDIHWFDGKMIDFPPDQSTIQRKVRYWDLAASERKIIPGRGKTDPDETVGSLVSFDGHNFFIEDQVGGRWAWDEIKRVILRTAELDGALVDVFVEEEPGSGGKNQVAEIDSFLKSNLPGHRGAKGRRPIHDRIIEANYWFSLASQGKVFIVKGSWNEMFFAQFSSFPRGHDDRITSVSGAILEILPLRKWRSIEFLSL